MYAIIRESTYDVAKLEAQGARALEEFQAIHAGQSGYAGTVVVEIDRGRWITVNLWREERDAQAALSTMVPVVKRLLEPLMASESTVIGAGKVLLTDMSKGAQTSTVIPR